MTPDPTDQAARTRIVDAHTENLFVDAGAGSGKTKQLVDRVVSMVSSGHLDSLRHLAAITFTESAAAELRTRIREALEDAAGLATDPTDPTDPTDRGRSPQSRRCARALEEIDDASITTLHGFAARLLADAPLEAGLPPGFGVQDAVRTSIDRDTWWRTLLDDWFDDPALAEVWRVGLTLDLNPTFLREVLTAFDNNWDLLVDCPIPGQPLPALDSEAMLAPLRALLDYVGGRSPAGDRLTERIDSVLAPLALEASAEADPLQVLAILHKAPLTPAGNRAAWAGAGLDKATACAFLDQAREARDRQLAGCRVAVTTALTERLRRAVLAHADRRRDRGELWFHDLLVHAVRLLRDDAAVRAGMRARWQVLCVDEFQDTDPLQVELVHLVAGLGSGPWHEAAVDGGRLFFVGDPKQSIYRFRRAEVALFAQVRDAYERGRLGLVQSFRSRPGVLDVVNTVFSGLFGDEPTVGYQPLHAARPDVTDDPGPDVLLLGGPSTQRMSEIRETEASHVAGTLARARGSWLVVGPSCADGTRRLRPATYADMAILVPTRTSLNALEHALDERDVPYRVMSRSLIWESDAVRDLVTVLQAVDEPADEVALVAALRHPMFGCSDDDLVAWKAAGGTWRYDAPPPDASEASPVAEAMTALRRYHDLRWWLPVNVLLDRIIRERRAVELTAAHPRARDHWRRLRFLVDQARLFLDSGGAGLTGFVRWAREQIDSAADAVEAVTPERDDDAVQIHTIHGAKGLEFPLVALTGINAPPVTRGHVLWPVAAPPEVTLFKGFTTAGYTDAQQAEKALAEQENLRLLYVGMTRAADHLVLSLYHHPPKNGTVDTHAARLFTTLVALQAAGAGHEPVAPPVVTRPVPTQRDPQGEDPLDDRHRFLRARADLLTSLILRLPTTATGLVAAAAGQDEPSDPLEATTGEGADGTRPSPRRPARGGAALGSAVHRALEIVDLRTWDDGSLDRAVTAACAELGVVPLTAEVRARVRAALAAPVVQLARERRHWKEVPVVARLDGRIVEGFIDLVVDTGDGLVVVDYKTDSARSSAEVAVKVRHYTPQLRAYAQALRVATGRPVAQPQLLFCRPGGAEAVVVPPEPPDEAQRGERDGAAP